MNTNNYNPQQLPGAENPQQDAANNNLQTAATNNRTFFEPEVASPENAAMPYATMYDEDAEADNAYTDAMAFCDWDDDYGTSGERYGWYNDFSDDVIDDAFDGEPEATWNVD
jgi:hypothetical protein